MGSLVMSMCSNSTARHMFRRFFSCRVTIACAFAAHSFSTSTEVRRDGARSGIPGWELLFFVQIFDLRWWNNGFEGHCKRFKLSGVGEEGDWREDERKKGDASF